jgi:hypothetical protein
MSSITPEQLAALAAQSQAQAQAQRPTPAAQAAQAYQAAGISPDQLAAFAAYQQAQSPAAQAAAMSQLAQSGIAVAGQQAAAMGAAPLNVPSFEQELADYKQRAALAEAQLAQTNANVQAQMQAMQNQLNQLQGSVPAVVDPVTDSAGKIVAAVRDVPPSDAKNILLSALKSHFVNLGLDLARVL